jgi:hypothetical protein
MLYSFLPLFSPMKRQDFQLQVNLRRRGGSGGPRGHARTTPCTSLYPSLSEASGPERQQPEEVQRARVAVGRRYIGAC